jgi:hypothetical protein
MRGRVRRNAEDRLRAALRRFKAESTDLNFNALARLASQAGQPLVRFTVSKGGSGSGPRDPDGSCVWLAINVSGRGVPAGEEIEDDEWLSAHLAQFPASQEPIVRLLADAANAFPPAHLERWTEIESVNSRLRLSGGDYRRRVERSAVARSGYRELFQEAGFTIGHTGGGCTAWILGGENFYAMITGEGAGVPDEHDEEILVGIYDNAGENPEGDLAVFPNMPEGARAAVDLALREVAR